jgi:signal transduction histidine kinase
LLYRGEAMGVLAAFDRGSNCEAFTEDDEQLLRTFAASAATAVALAQSVQADRLRSSMAAADAERQRWARELHDETLQGLGALQVLLSSALRRGDSQRRGQAMHDAVEQIKDEIENLRTIITELRPAALDELGLETALEALLERHREHSGLEVEADLSLAATVTGKTRQDPELESTAYRLVQEALTNVVKHSRAQTVRVTVRETAGQLLIEVRDDGAGFDPEAVSRGFGLAGMRERARLAGGTLSIDSDERGTLVRVSLPVQLRPTNRAAM